MKAIRLFFVFLLILRTATFFLSKNTPKLGDIVQISGRMTKEANFGYKTVDVNINDHYVVQVPFKMIKVSYKSLNWRKIVIRGSVSEIKNNLIYITPLSIKFFPEDYLQTILRFFETMRNSIKNDFFRILPKDEAEIAGGILIGQTKNVSPQLLDSFYKTGTIHLFAASGMNLILFCGFIREMLNLFLRKRRALAVSMMFAVIYVFLAGFAASILRAAVMVTFVNLAEILGRSAKGFYSLGVALGILVFISPGILFDLGFQLSVMSTLGVMITPLFHCYIVSLLRKVIRIWAGMTKIEIEKSKILSQQWSNGAIELSLIWKQNVQWVLRMIGKGLIANFAVSTCCFVMTAPLIMFSFGKINLISPVVNLCILWMVEWIMLFAGMIVVLNWVMKPFGIYPFFLSYIIYPFLFAFKWVVQEFSKIDWGVISLSYGLTTILLLLFSLSGWIVFLIKKSNKCEQ